MDGIVGWGKFRTGTITGGNVLGLVPKVGVKFSELTSKKASFFNKAWHAVAQVADSTDHRGFFCT